MTGTSAGGRACYDYEVKARSAFNSRHKAPPVRAFETTTHAFFNAKFIETDYVNRGNEE